MKDAIYGGVNAAVLTAMGPDLTPDLDRMAAHAKWLLANGCTGLGVLGTTGEANSFGLHERKAILEGLIARGIPAAKMMPVASPARQWMVEPSAWRQVGATYRSWVEGSGSLQPTRYRKSPTGPVYAVTAIQPHFITVISGV